MQDRDLPYTASESIAYLKQLFNARFLPSELPTSVSLTALILFH